MSLTILSVASPRAPVGPNAVGSAEQVVSMLDEHLLAAGHRSVVIACEGSSVRGELITTPRVCSEQQAHTAHREAIERALRAYAVDVLHLHGPDFQAYLPAHAPATLVSLHMPPEWYASDFFQHAPPGLFLHCVSQSQHERCPHVPHLLPAIPSGVNLDHLWQARRRRSFALVLGRICAEKGIELALQAAQRTDTPLVIAGELPDTADRRQYFHDCVEPLLDARRRFIGPVSLARKRRLLGAARCILMPSLVPESSSLVAMEALACGTPVIALRSGALPDIITHGHTGWLVDNTDQLANALHAAGTISSMACRRSAELQFSAHAMGQRYVGVYEQIRISQPSAAPALQVIEPQFSRVHELTTLQQLERLAPAWARLHARCPGATPHQSPAWLLPWCRRNDLQRFHALAIYRGPELLGLAPLLIYRQDDTRILTLLGNADAHPQDVLFNPLHATACLSRLRSWLSDHRHEWDRCDFGQLRHDSVLSQLNMSELAARRSGVRERLVSGLTGLAGSTEPHQERLAQRMARQQTSYLRAHRARARSSP